jgi:hypothetical protein
VTENADSDSECGPGAGTSADDAGDAVESGIDAGGVPGREADGAGFEFEFGSETDAGSRADGAAGGGADPPRSDAAVLDERLRAVERAVADDAADVEAAPGPAVGEDLAGRLADVEERVADLEAGLQAVRGQLDHVAAVDEAVERRADAALAAAESARESADSTDGSDRPEGSGRRIPPSEREGAALPDPPAPPVAADGEGLLARFRAWLP